VTAHAQVTETYVFNDSLLPLEGVGPALEPVYNGTEVITTSGDGDFVDGSFETITITACGPSTPTVRAWSFPQYGGLRHANLAPAVVTESYTISMLVRFSPLNGGYSRLIDFSNSTADDGIYVYDTEVSFYPVGTFAEGTWFDDQDVFVTITRDAATKIVSLYINGLPAGEYLDVGDEWSPADLYVPAASTMYFLMDNTEGSANVSESSPGVISYLQLSDTHMTPEQVIASLDGICNVLTCGDGTLSEGEVCDDGNRDSGDGCDPACKVELGYPCDAGEDCASGLCSPSGVCFDGTMPTATIENSDDSTKYCPNSPSVAIDPSVTVTGEAQIDGATVAIVAGFEPGDTLAAQDTASITSTYDPTTGVLRVAGDGTVADYQAFLRGVTFSTNSYSPAVRQVSFTLGRNSLYLPDTGHFYRYVAYGEEDDRSWYIAKDAATRAGYFGLRGYLATVSSDAENAFVTSKLSGTGWIGASDEAEEGIWRWVTGPEGLMDNGLGLHFFTQPSEDGIGGTGGVAENGLYNAWSGGEPNDWRDDGGEGEDCAHFYLDGLWNDFRWDNSDIEGYVIEFGGMPTDPQIQVNDIVEIKPHCDITCTPKQCEATSVSNGFVCEITYSADGTTCDDGNALTANDACNGEGLCVGSFSCDDGIQNGDETGIDCGGECAACPVPECDDDADCESGICRDGQCIAASCGDSVIQQGEGCDDGNSASGDGCSADCKVEAGWTCDPSKAEDAANVVGPSTCDEVDTCGNGAIEGDEACDDGNSAGADGCSAACEVESGWVCAGTTVSVCTDDTDEDGVKNVDDNCPDVSNASQLNSDSDDEGDACDADDDGDGVADTADNCPLNANEAQADADDDGVGDACEDDAPSTLVVSGGGCASGGISADMLVMLGLASLVLGTRMRRSRAS
jgi:cysteine-rich repeat protein